MMQGLYLYHLQTSSTPNCPELSVEPLASYHTLGPFCARLHDAHEQG